jgi:hypothetical protein
MIIVVNVFRSKELGMKFMKDLKDPFALIIHVKDVNERFEIVNKDMIIVYPNVNLWDFAIDMMEK